MYSTLDILYRYFCILYLYTFFQLRIFHKCVKCKNQFPPFFLTRFDNLEFSLFPFYKKFSKLSFFVYMFKFHIQKSLLLYV